MDAMLAQVVNDWVQPDEHCEYELNEVVIFISTNQNNNLVKVGSWMDLNWNVAPIKIII